MAIRLRGGWGTWEPLGPVAPPPPPPPPPQTVHQGTFTVILSPHPPFEGDLPIYRHLPRVRSANIGNLHTITNSNQYPIVLVRSSDNARIVTLQPRQTTTADNLNALYGSQMPQLPLTFTVYVGAQLSAPPVSTVTITYSYIE
jgi:hypothetical protein